MRFLLVILLLFPSLGWSQAFNQLGKPNYFGFQYRHILPMQQMQSGKDDRGATFRPGGGVREDQLPENKKAENK